MPSKTMTQYQVSIAAEAFAACVLAHGGCEVSIKLGQDHMSPLSHPEFIGKAIQEHINAAGIRA